MTDNQLKDMTMPKTTEKIWEVTRADYQSPELRRALHAGWEPFGAVSEAQNTVILLRRKT